MKHYKMLLLAMIITSCSQKTVTQNTANDKTDNCRKVPALIEKARYMLAPKPAYDWFLKKDEVADPNKC